MSDKITIRTDGGANPNPGRAGSAFTIEKNGKIICAHCEYSIFMTNNEAEYTALLMAVEYAKAHFEKALIEVISDSELLVKQMNGEYKIKSSKLIQIKSKIDELSKGMKMEFKWNGRDKNKIADGLVRFIREGKKSG